MRKSVFTLGLTMALAVALLAGCGQPVTAPTATAAMEPAKVAAKPPADVPEDKPTVAGPTTEPDDANALRLVWLVSPDDADWMGQRVEALRDLLRPLGWHIQPDMLVTSDPDDPQIAATPADAFVCGPSMAAQMQKRGIVMDVTALAAKDAPVLAEKYADLLGSSAAGVPVFVDRNPGRQTVGLIIEKDKAPADAQERFQGISDVVKWLESDPSLHLGRGMPGISEAMPLRTSLRLWAGEQGYYPLETIGVRGGLFARFDDPKATPVPLESIEGFAAFYERLVALWNGGQLFDFADRSNEQSIGYLGWLSLSYDYLREKDLTGSDYLAIPLKGGVWRQAFDQPETDWVMSIPTTGQRAADVLKLAEWVMTTQEGADLSRYGVLDSDYELMDGRVSQVEEGPNLPALNLFSGDGTLLRPTIYDPSNVADIQTMEAPELPILSWAIRHNLFEQAEKSPLQAVSDANEKLILNRQNLLWGLLPTGEDGAAQPVTKVSAALRLLEALKPRTAELVQAYQVELAKLTKE